MFLLLHNCVRLLQFSGYIDAAVVSGAERLLLLHSRKRAGHNKVLAIVEIFGYFAFVTPHTFADQFKRANPQDKPFAKSG